LRGALGRSGKMANRLFSPAVCRRVIRLVGDEFRCRFPLSLSDAGAPRLWRPAKGVPWRLWKHQRAGPSPEDRKRR
jgi:hypothetical protein